jgi:hypothetical protein
MLLLGAITAMLSVPIANTQAQDTLSPTWTKGSYNTPLEYSYNGAVVLTRDSNQFRAWSTSTRKLIAVVGVSNHLATPAPDGSGVYYATGSPVKYYFYNFTTRNTTLVKAEGSGFGGVSAMTVSTDGSSLAVSVYNTTAGKYYIKAYTISNGTQLGSYSAIAAGVNVPQLAYVDNNTKILVGGTSCRTLTSACVWIANKNNMGLFALNPARTVAYSKGTDGKLYAFDVTAAAAPLNNLYSVTSNIDANFQSSSDGQVLVSGGSAMVNTAGTHYAIRFYKASDGSLINGSLDYSVSTYCTYYISNPATNEVVFFSLDGGAHLERWTFNSSTGAGTKQTDLDRGVVGANVQAFGTTTPYFGGDDPNFGGVRVFDATTGNETSYSPNYQTQYSPDGQYYSWLGSRPSDSSFGVHVARVSDGTIVASYLSANVDAAGWNESGQLWAHLNTFNKVRVMNFTGSALNLINEVSGPSTATVYLSKDATRLAWWNSNQIVVYNVTAATEIGSFEGGGSSNIVRVGFAGNYLWLHQWLFDGASTYTNQIQIRDVSTNAFTTIKTVGYDSSSTYGNDTGYAVLSKDRTIAAFARYVSTGSDNRAVTEMKVVRVADGQVLKSYNSQFADWYFRGLEFSTDNATLLSTGYYSGVLIGSPSPVVLSAISVTPTTVVGGNNSTGTVTINRPAPVGGVSVTLSSNNSAASVPASVTVTEGNTSANFNVTTTGVASDQTPQITATYDGLALSTVLTVTKPTAITIGFNPNSVDGGQSSTGTASINGKAPTGGYSVNLSSNKASVTVPGSVIIPEGQTSVTFTATTTEPSSTETATVTGSNGAVSGQGMLEVKGGGASVSIVETAVKGGNALTLRITIPNPAPVGGTTFNLTGDSLSVPPATAKIAEGKTTIDVGVNTNATLNDATTTVTVTPAAGGSAKQASATVQAPLIRALYLAQSPVAGVKTVKLLVLLDGIAPSGLSFNVTASTTAVTVPTTVTIPAGALFATIDVATKKQTAKKTVKITIGSKFVNIILQAQP